MPVRASTYKKPWYLFNKHLETIYPSRYRSVADVTYNRERLELNDGDFLDLDWSINPSNQTKQPLVIITHGLEGSSHRTYVKGLVHYFNEKKWDALAWNCRSCSNEMNRLSRFYHHGDYKDLDCIVKHAIKKGYISIGLVGGSMGGSITIKYLATTIQDSIIGGAVYSTPIDLGEAALILDQKNRTFYRNRFLVSLKRKIKEKQVLFPDIISNRSFDEIQSFYEFDKTYTAPLHGYKDPEDYYTKGSTHNDLKNISVPLFMCSALNDPFIGPSCFPFEIARENKYITFESPKHGGHLGFYMSDNKTYVETSAYKFLNELLILSS